MPVAGASVGEHRPNRQLALQGVLLFASPGDGWGIRSLLGVGRDTLWEGGGVGSGCNAELAWLGIGQEHPLLLRGLSPPQP